MSVIFADSSCDLSSKFLKSYGVEVINLKLNINNKNCLYNADNFDFAEYYNNGNYLVDYVNLKNIILKQLTMALNTCQDVLVITSSKHFNPLFNVVSEEIKALKQKYSEQKIYVIDSGLISVAYATVVFEAAIINSTGVRADELVKKLNKLVGTYETLIIPSSTNFELFNKFNFAKSLGVKPLISLSNNKLELVGSVKGKLKLTADVINRILQNGFNVADYPVGVMYGKSNLSDANKIIAEVSNKFETKVWSGYYNPMLANLVGDNALIISYHKRND